MQNMDYILPNSNNINITDEEFLAMIGNTSTGLGILDRSNNLTDYNNMTMVIHYNGYPSGYSIPSIIFASVIVTILMIVIVVGNMLVIIAIATEKALKNIQNWFIASLAVADFFLGLVIMPFSLANELMGYWVFGKFWCDIHSAMDVLLCTASIMNLCLISLDRYWSITQAVEYLKSRTPARAAFMIAFVWVMSGLICIPPLLGWKANEPEGTLPQCQLSQEIGYVLYSALGSFYIPSCIMVFVYIRIYFAAKARARRQLRKQPRKPPSDQVTSFTNPPKGTIPMPHGPSASTNKQTIPIPHNPTQTGSSDQTDANKNNNAETPIPIVTCDFASDVSTSEAGGENEYELKDTLKVNALVTNADNKGKATTMSTSKNDKNVSSSALTVNMSTSNSPLPGRNRALSVGIDADMVSEFDPSSSDSGVVSRCAVVKPLKFRLCQPIFGKKSSKSSNKDNHDYRHNNGEHKKRKNKKKSHAVVVNELQPAIPPKPRDPEKEKRRIARKKEKRATLILGLIMGSFLACWIPFFFLYILTPFVPESCIPESAFAVAFWLGYMNSALNPAIYTIFNKDFRRAFRRILFK